MSDPASTARTARESLARGLAALQSDPNVPPALLELAAPIAQSMGALHQIERSNGTQLLPHAHIALENVRSALSHLQAQSSAHPAVAAAMEAVASSLGLVHALNQLAGPQAAAPVAAAPVAAAAAAPQAPRPGGTQPVMQQPMQPQPAAQQAVAMQQPVQQVQPQHQQYAMPQPQAPMQQPQQVYQHAAQQPMHQQHQQPPMQVGHAPQVQPAAPMYAQQPMQGHGAPMAQTVAAPQQYQPQQAQPQQFAPSPSPGVARDPFAPNAPAAGPGPGEALGDKQVIPADLGAQSPTNFYKGLSGNDIVDHGGLFVSTYMIPKIGTPIRLRVALPGGYEFEADAVVRWARDVRDASSDAPPGFGAQFTGITAEARQLIYRYVRNREPLFHDDL